MTAAHPPGPDEPRPDERCLDDRERAVLDDIAGHENASDPGFVRALASSPAGEDGGVAGSEIVAWARRRDRVIQIAVVAVLAAFLLPTAWVLAAVLAATLLVGPGWLLRQAIRERGAPKSTREE